MESPPRPSAPREFILENQLGSGAFSQVWLAQHVSLRKKVAIKVISKQSVRTPKGHSRFIRETEIQKRVHHPYIASLFYVSENILHHYLVMEYVNGITLQNRISNSGHISEFEAQHYFLQIFSAISYLHEKLKVIHRDLKADNIMIDQNNNIRLIDFGFACDIDDDEELRKCCGSPRYSAPEMYTEKLCSTASDMWSLGVILFYMVSGKLPFDSHSPNQLVQKIVHQRPQFPPLISDNLYNLLHGLLRKNREKRFTCEDVRNHPWVKQSNTIPLYSLDDATDFGSSESLGTKIKKREMNTLKLAGVEPTSDLVSPQPEVNSFQTPPLSPHMESDTSDTSPTTSVNTQITSSIEKQLPPTASPTVQPYLSPKVSTNEKSNEKKIPVIRSNTHDMKNLTHNQNPSLTPKRMTAQERLLSSGKFRPLVSHNKSNSMGAKELENAYPVPTSHIRQRLNSSKNPDTILKAFMKPSDLL